MHSSNFMYELHIYVFLNKLIDLDKNNGSHVITALLLYNNQITDAVLISLYLNAF